MDSTRPIPFNAAVAYGIKPLQTRRVATGALITPPLSAPVAATRAVTAAQTAATNAASRAPDRATTCAPSRVANLVSGKVDSAISRGQGFDAPRGAPMPNASGALQMYSRAADRVEVATEATVGRRLDVRG